MVRETETIPTKANNARVNKVGVVQGDGELAVRVLFRRGGYEGFASRALPALLEPPANAHITMLMTAPGSRESLGSGYRNTDTTLTKWGETGYESRGRIGGPDVQWSRRPADVLPSRRDQPP
jgi:hypothetical protein